MTYPTRQECDKSFDEQWQGKGINTIQIFGEIKSHISTLRKNDLAFLRGRLGEMKKRHGIVYDGFSPEADLTIYNQALDDFLSLLTECEEKLK